MRDVLDPKHHFKANDNKGIPKYFQMGSFVDSAADFYSERAIKATRKKVSSSSFAIALQSRTLLPCFGQTLVDTLLQDAKFRKRAKDKFIEIQRSRESSHRRQKYPKRSK
eukprot:m.230070 g.230070  ORF g.230070 m.230070 type:complete len:110 (+) comp54264_c0_seq10:592-921(+)